MSFVRIVCQKPVELVGYAAASPFERTNWRHPVAKEAWITETIDYATSRLAWYVKTEPPAPSDDE